MGKIISFELKKCMSHIGTYILIICMAILLIITAFVYKPEKRTATSLSLPGDNVSEMYYNFTNSGIKDSYDIIVEEVGAQASSYVVKSSLYNKYNNPDTINDLFDTFDNKCMEYYNTTNATMAEYAVLLADLNNAFNNLTNALDEALGYCKDETGYYVLIINDDYTNLYTTLDAITTNFKSPSDHQKAGSTYYNEYRDKLINCLNQLIYPDLNNTAEKYYLGGGYYTVVKSRLSEIAKKMENEYNKVVADSSLENNKTIIKEINSLFNRYVNVINVYQTAFDADICVNALSNLKSNTERQNLIGYSNVDVYKQSEIVVEYEYYLTHHSNPEDYANSFSVTHTSNFKENAYDYTFFVLSIFAILIIVFALYMSANIISGEINKNTMRFTAIKPIKRGSIFFGKYLAIMIISAIMLVISSLLAFLVGAIMFGVDTSNMLMIINGSNIFVAHPAFMIVMFVLSILLQIAVYSSIAMMLSSFIKSDLICMVISVLFYIVNLMLPIFFGANSWLRFYPFVNVNLFAYFGANRLTNDSILAKLFNNIVYNGMNIWISIIYIIGITTLVLLIGKTIFKRREL